MPKYIVSYDLRGEERGEDYTKLEKTLKDTYRAKRLLQSVWGLSSELTYIQLYTRIKRFVKPGDGIMLVHITAGRGSGLENKLSSF